MRIQIWIIIAQKDPYIHPPDDRDSTKQPSLYLTGKMMAALNTFDIHFLFFKTVSILYSYKPPLSLFFSSCSWMARRCSALPPALLLESSIYISMTDAKPCPYHPSHYPRLVTQMIRILKCSLIISVLSSAPSPPMFLYTIAGIFVPGLWYLFNMRMNVSILPDALFPLLLGLGYPCLTLLRRFLQECPSYHSHTEIKSAVVANGPNPPFHLVFIFCSVDGYMITPALVFVNTFL